MVIDGVGLWESIELTVGLVIVWALQQRIGDTNMVPDLTHIDALTRQA